MKKRKAAHSITKFIDEDMEWFSLLRKSNENTTFRFGGIILTENIPAKQNR